MTADLLVVGGGVIGVVTAALAALDHPEWTVRLVERARLGHGATGASAGLSFPLARTPWQRSLVRAADSGYRRLLAEQPGLPLHDIDVLWVLRPEERRELAERLVDDEPVAASPTQLAALARAYPDLVVGADEEVVSTSAHCFYTYAAPLVNMLVDRLRSTDAVTVWEGSAVERVEPDGGDWRVTLDTGDHLRARRVVSAVGPWPSGSLVPGSRLADRLRVKKVAALHLAHRPPPDAPCVVFWADDAFVLPLPEREYCLFSYHNTTWDVLPDQPFALTPADVRAALEVLEPRSAALAATRAGGRAFCDGYTEDLVPVVAGGGGLAEVGGCCGSGVRLAPGLAAAALETVDLAGSTPC